MTSAAGALAATRLPELERPDTAYLVGGGVLVALLAVLTAVLLLQTRDRGDPAALERRIGRALARLDIESLEGHVVVCGAGGAGEPVADELARRGVPVVLVERDPAAARRLRAFFPHVYEGDAREAETLRRVRAECARGLVVCSASGRERRRVAKAARRAGAHAPVAAAGAADPPQAVVDALVRGPSQRHAR